MGKTFKNLYIYIHTHAQYMLNILELFLILDTALCLYFDPD